MSQKEKFALYLTPEMKARLERHYMEDGSCSIWTISAPTTPDCFSRPQCSLIWMDGRIS